MKDFILYTWNVLHPSISINIKTWDGDARAAKKDMKRYRKHRQDSIMMVLCSWVEECKKCVICLQEVNGGLLREIMRVFGGGLCDVHWSGENGDYRVTIMKGYKGVGSGVNAGKKSVLKVVMKDKLIIYNMHIYWKSDDEDVVKIGRKVRDDAGDYAFIICGDLNKELNELGDFMQEAGVDGDVGSGSTGIHTRTGEMAIIDHVFVSKGVKMGTTSIIKNVNGCEIMYNKKRILEGKSGCNDISDHLPVKFLINGHFSN